MMNPHSPSNRDETSLSTRHAAPVSVSFGTRRLVLMSALLAFSFLLGACGASGSPVKTFTKGDTLAYYDFSQPGSFEEGAFNDGKVRLEVRGGTYHMELSVGDSVLWYGQWGDTLGDVVVDVDATQTTQDTNTVYGLICRARGTLGQPPVKSDPALTALAQEGKSDLVAGAVQSLASAESTAESTAEATSESTAEATREATSEPTAVPAVAATTAAPEATSEASSSLNVNNGDGYLFLVEGSGRFSIQRSHGGQVVPLVDWTESSAIKTGPAKNTLRAVCMGNYLAFYINGSFMADTSDDTYAKGQVGLAAAAGGRLGNQVEYDNLTVYEAKPG